VVKYDFLIYFQVMVCDNLALPYRDDSFDAVLSVAVVHHFATTERRVNALRELARVLRIGGRLLISVWAMEQRHRKVCFFLTFYFYL
jgi:SAM-dependent methyltransferase